jgi:hypothetical protein
MSIGLRTILDTFLPRLFGVIDKLVLDKDAAEKLKAELKRQAADIDHAEQMAIYAQFAAEFGHARNAFDSFVDGANRLVRPLVTYGLIALMVALVWYGMRDPALLEEFAQAMSAIPTMIWALFVAVFSFWFGGRTLKDWGQFVASERPPRYQQSGSPIADSQQPPPSKPARVPIYNQ